MNDDTKSPGAAPAAASAIRLPVLAHSGKVDELRRQMEADRATPTTAAQPAATDPPPAPPAFEAPADAPAAHSAPSAAIQRKLLEGKIIEALRQIYDPEIPVNIYELGLIYEIDVKDDNAVKVKMTLTAPACPVAGTLPGEVEKRVENVPEVKSAEVELVWDPPWDRSRMSEAAMLQLGFF